MKYRNIYQNGSFSFAEKLKIGIRCCGTGESIGNKGDAFCFSDLKVTVKEHGYRGIYTQGQDNNLAACLFYLKNGFVIGGLDAYM